MKTKTIFLASLLPLLVTGASHAAAAKGSGDLALADGKETEKVQGKEGDESPSADQDPEQSYKKSETYVRLELIDGIAKDLSALKDAHAEALKDAKVKAAFVKADKFIEDATNLAYAIDETKADTTAESIQETHLVAKTGSIIGAVSILVSKLESSDETNELITSLIDKLEKLRKL